MYTHASMRFIYIAVQDKISCFVAICDHNLSKHINNLKHDGNNCANSIKKHLEIDGRSREQ